MWVAYLLLFAALAGRFSIDRIGQRFQGLGVLGDARLWLMPVAVFAVLGLAARISAMKARMDRKLTRYIILTCVLHLYLAASALWTRPFGSGTPRVPEVLMNGMLVLLTAMTFLRLSDGAVHRFHRFSFGVFGLMLLVALTGVGREGTRLATLWGGPNVFGRWMGSAAVLSLYLSIRRSRLRWSWLSAPFLVALFLTGSRGAVLATLVALAVFVVPLQSSRREAWRALTAVVLSAVAIAGLLAGPLRSAAGPYISERYGKLTLEQRYVSDRGRFFEAAWNQFKAHPIEGVGLNGLATDEEILGYPHNIVLNVAAEAGTIALILLLAALFAAMPGRDRNLPLEYRAAFALGILYLVASLFSGTYYDTRMMWIYFTLALVATWPPGRSKQPRGETRRWQERALLRQTSSLRLPSSPSARNV